MSSQCAGEASLLPDGEPLRFPSGPLTPAGQGQVCPQHQFLCPGEQQPPQAEGPPPGPAEGDSDLSEGGESRKPGLRWGNPERLCEPDWASDPREAGEGDFLEVPLEPD